MIKDSTDEPAQEGRQSHVSRRRFIEAAGVSGVAVGVAGYAGEVEAQGTTTVQVAWDQLAADTEGIKKALHDAGLSKDVEIDILAGSWGGGRRTQYQQWLSAGREKPDMLLMDTGWTIPFVARNQVVDLSQKLPEQALETIDDDYFQASVQATKGSNGNIHAVPLFVGLPTMQYRKDSSGTPGTGTRTSRSGPPSR